MVSIIYFIHLLAANAAATWSDEYNGRQYYISYDSFASFENATTACSTLDSDALLVMIKTEGVQTFLESILRGSHNAFPNGNCGVDPLPGDIFYIGLSYVGVNGVGNCENLEWIDGTKLCENDASPSWANWASGGPITCADDQYTCAVMSGNIWYLSLCTQNKQYICERPTALSVATTSIDGKWTIGNKTSPSYSGTFPTTSMNPTVSLIYSNQITRGTTPEVSGTHGLDVLNVIIIVVVIAVLIVVAVGILLWRRSTTNKGKKLDAPLSFTSNKQEQTKTNETAHDIDPVYSSTSKEETNNEKQPIPKYSVVKKLHKYENNIESTPANENPYVTTSQTYSTVNDAVSIENTSAPFSIEDGEQDPNPFNALKYAVNGSKQSAGHSGSSQNQQGKKHVYDAVSKPNNYEDIKDLPLEQDNPNHYYVAEGKPAEREHEVSTVYDNAQLKDEKTTHAEVYNQLDRII